MKNETALQRELCFTRLSKKQYCETFGIKERQYYYDAKKFKAKPSTSNYIDDEGPTFVLIKYPDENEFVRKQFPDMESALAWIRAYPRSVITDSGFDENSGLHYFELMKLF